MARRKRDTTQKLNAPFDAGLCVLERTSCPSEIRDAVQQRGFLILVVTLWVRELLLYLVLRRREPEVLFFYS